MLPYHLAVYSTFCDRIIVLLDEWPQSEAICRSFPKCEVHHWKRRAKLPTHDEHGAIFEEGALRQRAWDLAMRWSPDLVVLGDTDEIPTPDIGGWLASNPDPSVEVWYADWVTLIGDAHHAIGGTRSPWSYQVPTNNKKGLIVRPIPGKQYRYRQGLQHVRMEPSPLAEDRAVLDDAHRIGPVRLLHFHYADWTRWQSQPLSQTPKYRRLADDAEIVPVPPMWHWPLPMGAR